MLAALRSGDSRSQCVGRFGTHLARTGLAQLPRAALWIWTGAIRDDERTELRKSARLPFCGPAEELV